MLIFLKITIKISDSENIRIWERHEKNLSSTIKKEVFPFLEHIKHAIEKSIDTTQRMLPNIHPEINKYREAIKRLDVATKRNSEWTVSEKCTAEIWCDMSAANSACRKINENDAAIILCNIPEKNTSNNT